MKRFIQYELGIRNLNSSQLATLSQIELLLTDEPVIAATAAINLKAGQTNTAMLKKMEKRLEKANFDCIKLKRKLDILQSNYAQNQRLWHLISILKAKSQSGTQLMAYLDVLEIKCLEKSEACSLDQQTTVTLNISLLEFEQEALRKIIES
ncbi:hypothetical protein GJU39_23030 [Pedobacter petrophilus]|uniref:Uncharacterized protein n=1 Tax=Pedobacter petrophilus TaxID=1908241 RepID=A0A7K0G5L1_9SPHI|nr:hypothetical protein [Pedobacter petrophilus]MRX78941.1 hypothetical protein [Pedobacter petrophilus]